MKFVIIITLSLIGFLSLFVMSDQIFAYGSPTVQKNESIPSAVAPPSLNSVTLLNKFNGDPNEPHSVSFFTGTYYTDSFSVANYFLDTSYGQFQLMGSVQEWRELPKPASGYETIQNAFHSSVIQDVIDLHDPFVDFSNIDHIFLVFNEGGCNCAFAVSDNVQTDEGNILFTFSYLSDGSTDMRAASVNTPSHELGHILGWRHVPPPTGCFACNPWSLMGGAGFENNPIGTIAFNRDQAGWIPSADIKTVSNGEQTTFTLDILSDPSPGENYLMGKVPFGSSGEYYTLEARKNSTFDQTPLDQFGLLIHHYNPNGHPSSTEPSAPVNLVDTTGNSDYVNADLDLGLSYAANGVLICHESQTANTITVFVDNNASGPGCSFLLPPIITSPANGDIITTSIVTLTGTAEANVIIVLFDGETPLGNTTADSNGDWIFTTGALSDGSHFFEAFTSNGVNSSILFSFANITIDTTGAVYLSTIGTQGTDNGQFIFPEGIALDSSDNIYVTGGFNDRVQIFDSSGNFLSTFGTEGTDNGQFNDPDGIALDSFGNIYVADRGSDRVQIFDSSGNFLLTFGTSGSDDGQFNTPSGIALDSSANIYVTDTFNDRVQIFDSSGNFLSTFGTSGSDDGQFITPSGIALDSSGNIYVADKFNDRVQIFDSNGNFLSTFGTRGSDEGQLVSPEGVVLDSTGNIYVADRGNDRVQIFDSSGNFLETFGNRGSIDGKFKFPEGIALDSSGNIYVADKDNHRVQKFSPFVVPAPTVISAQTTSTTSIVLTMSETVFDSGAVPSHFTISGVASNPSVTSFLVSGNIITLSLSSEMTNLDTPTVSYVNPTLELDIVNAADEPLDDFVIPVTNNISAVPLTTWTQAVIDLRATKSTAFQDLFPIDTNEGINRLLAWAGNPVAQANNPELQEFGHLYSIMKRWNERTDLQEVFTGADLAADPVDLVIWSGRANVLANEFNSDLVPHEPTYVLLRYFFLERDDLRANPVFAGALDGSDPKRLFCFAENSSDVRLTPHQAFYDANCVL